MNMEDFVNPSDTLEHLTDSQLPVISFTDKGSTPAENNLQQNISNITENETQNFETAIIEVVERQSDNGSAIACIDESFPGVFESNINEEISNTNEKGDSDSTGNKSGLRRRKLKVTADETVCEESVTEEESEGEHGGLDQVIKISPSDIELDECSNLDRDAFFDEDFSIKEEQLSSDDDSIYSSSISASSKEDKKYLRKRRAARPARYCSDPEGSGDKVKSELETDLGLTDTDGEGVRKSRRSKRRRVTMKKSGKKKGTSKSTTPKEKRGRGRPKAPRRLDGTDVVTSEEDVDDGNDQETPVRTGSGYRVEFKMRVLKYAETHSNSATAEKFGLNAKRIREWKRVKDKIGLEKEGLLKRRPRSAGFTVQEKLQAVQFARERSTDEARLLYGVDRRTIEKWRANEEQLEARLKSGQGDALRDGSAGRKPRFTHIEDKLRDWVVALRLKGVTVNCRMILNKACKLVAEANSQNEQQQAIKGPSTWSWVIGFLKRQNLMGLLGTTLGHEDPSELLTVDIRTNAGEDLTALAHQPIEIPENPNKRHRRSISLQDKINIINRIEKGETQGVVAKSLGVATSTVQTIWSCRSDILRRYLNPKAKPKSAAFLWKKYSVIANALFDWYEQSVMKNFVVTGGALFDKAIKLSETYRISDEFKIDAKEWFKQFCKRHKLMDKCNEIFPANSSAINNTNNSSNVVSIPPSSFPVSSNVTPLPPTSQSQTDSFDHSAASDDFHHAEADFNDFLFKTTSDNIDQKVGQVNLLTTPIQPSSAPVVATNVPHLTLVAHPTAPPPPTVQTQPAPNNSLFGVSSAPTSSSLNYPATVTITDALKYLGFVRSWIVANYGSGDANLNHHLSSIENAIFRKRPS